MFLCVGCSAAVWKQQLYLYLPLISSARLHTKAGQVLPHLYQCILILIVFASFDQQMSTN